MDYAPRKASSQSMLGWCAVIVCLTNYTRVKKSFVEKDLLRAQQDCVAQLVELEGYTLVKPLLQPSRSCMPEAVCLSHVWGQDETDFEVC
jgi:hypothetical protein